MIQSTHVVVHTTPDGQALPVRNDRGQVLLFGDVANAESFARALVEAGLPDAILADLHDLGLLSGLTHGSDAATLFEDGVSGLSAAHMRDAARELALQLVPSLRLD